MCKYSKNVQNIEKKYKKNTENTENVQRWLNIVVGICVLMCSFRFLILRLYYDLLPTTCRLRQVPPHRPMSNTCLPNAAPNQYHIHRVLCKPDGRTGRTGRIGRIGQIGRTGRIGGAVRDASAMSEDDCI